MNNETHKPTLDLSEIRKEVGGALWLLVTYADMAAKGWSAHDDDLAHVLGTSTFTILRWKIKLIKTGFISIEDTQDGGTNIVINRDVLFENSFSGTRSQHLAEMINSKGWGDLSATDREFLGQCGIKGEEACQHEQ